MLTRKRFYDNETCQESGEGKTKVIKAGKSVVPKPNNPDLSQAILSCAPQSPSEHNNFQFCT